MDDSLLISLGIMLIVIGMLFIIFSSLKSSNIEGEGVIVGFIGFVPFGFATSKKALLFGIAIMIIILIVVFFFILYSRGGL